MAPRSRQIARQQIGLGIRVVHSVDHRVLKGDPPTGGLKIPAAGIHQLFYAHAPVHRHDLTAGLVIGGMERNA